MFETHSRQDIDPDGFYLWKLAFGSFDRAQTVSDIVDKMLMPRFKGVLVNALEVGFDYAIRHTVFDLFVLQLVNIVFPSF